MSRLGRCDRCALDRAVDVITDVDSEDLEKN